MCHGIPDPTGTMRHGACCVGVLAHVSHALAPQMWFIMQSIGRPAWTKPIRRPRRALQSSLGPGIYAEYLPTERQPRYQSVACSAARCPVSLPVGA